MQVSTLSLSQLWGSFQHWGACATVLLSEKLNGRGAVTDDARPLVRGELRSIATQIAQVLPRVTDRQTKLHLEDLRDQTAKSARSEIPAGAADDESADSFSFRRDTPVA
jgi:hypothetical protein